MLSSFGVPKILSFATVPASVGAGTLATAASGVSATNVAIVAPVAGKSSSFSSPSAFSYRFSGYSLGFHLHHEYPSGSSAAKSARRHIC
jgi:hypothetical protein